MPELSRLDDAGAREVGQRLARELIDRFATDHFALMADDPNKRDFAIEGMVDWIFNGNGIDRNECSANDQLFRLNRINKALHDHYPVWLRKQANSADVDVADHIFVAVEARADEIFDAMKARAKQRGLKGVIGSCVR